MIFHAEGGLQCIDVDGKRDKKTLQTVVELIDGEEVKKFLVKQREHLVYTDEPAGEYLCHSELTS